MWFVCVCVCVQTSCNSPLCWITWIVSVFLDKTAWFYATALQCHVYTNCSSWHPGSNQTCGSTFSHPAYCSWTWARSEAGQETASNSQSKYLTHDSRKKNVTSSTTCCSRVSDFCIVIRRKELNVMSWCGINISFHGHNREGTKPLRELGWTMIQPRTFTCSWYTAAISWVYFSLICGCKWKVSDMSVETVLTYAISPLRHPSCLLSIMKLGGWGTA